MQANGVEQQQSAAPVPPDHQLPATTSETKRRRGRGWIWAVLLLAFGLLFLWVLRHHGASQQTATRRFGGPVVLSTVTAKSGDMGIYFDAIGTVTPVYTATIASEVTGIVTAVHYREGQMVHRGDPLLDIDPRPYEAQLLQAQGALERDVNLLAEARMDLTRYQVAWQRNAIARQQLEDQEKLVLQDEGTVKNDQGTVQYDQVQVSFCHITSPITGRVGLRLVDPGNLVQANGSTALAVVTQLDPITVIFTLAEDDLPPIQEQMRAGKQLMVDAYDRTQESKLATGKLLTIDNQIDTTTGTVKLRAQFSNPKVTLFPNQFVNTRLLVNTLHNQTIVPASAVQHNGQAAFVFLIVNETAQMRTVETGTTEGGMVAVTGINPGDVLANSGFEKLQSGSKVVVSQHALPANTSESKAP